MAEETSDGRLSEAQMLVVMSLIGKLAEVERKQRINGAVHPNGNGAYKGVDWRQYLFWAVTSMVGFLCWWGWGIAIQLRDIREEMIARRATLDLVKRLGDVSEDRHIRLSLLEGKVMAMDARLNVMGQRVLAINGRLDRYPVPPVRDSEENGP